MHTCYCDGTAAPEDMILSAIDKGLNTVGISGHSYTFFDESYCMQKAAVPRYLAECRYLRAKYFDRIHVLCGVEQDYYSDYPTDEFDYVIGSVHYVKVDDEYIPVDESVEILKDAVKSTSAVISTRCASGISRPSPTSPARPGAISSGILT